VVFPEASREREGASERASEREGERDREMFIDNQQVTRESERESARARERERDRGREREARGASSYNGAVDMFLAVSVHELVLNIKLQRCSRHVSCWAKPRNLIHSLTGCYEQIVFE
jgi:hypothetical protein